MTERPLLSFVVGARPNFVKAAPVIKAAISSGGFRTQTIHTGQHYDSALSELFFRDLALPQADLLLEVGSASHAVQTAEVMRRIEPLLLEHRPDCLIVFGDINSTVAAALTAAKLGIRVAHVESGLRSFDRSMPEEINRIVTDALSDLLFVTEPSGMVHLAKEGIAEDKVHYVGNTMIDSLRSSLVEARTLRADVLARHGLGDREYGVLTLHRPSNVDQEGALSAMLAGIAELSRELPILFPVHPRTRTRLEEHAAIRGLLNRHPDLTPCDPLGYLEFLACLDGARLALTDSGGIQEETTALGVQCLTLRDNTERPITIEQGTNRLAGTDPATILALARAMLAEPFDREAASPPPLWDGRAAERLVAVLQATLCAAP